jgi:hypothetical protein
MNPLDYLTEPIVNCPDSDVNDAAFVHVTRAIGGYDAVVVYLACGVYPLSTNLGFGELTEALTSVSKVLVPLPDLNVVKLDGVDDTQFVAKIEAAEKVIGSYSTKKHEACLKYIPNGGSLNRAFKKAGIAYATHPETGTNASVRLQGKEKLTHLASQQLKWRRLQKC